MIQSILNNIFTATEFIIFFNIDKELNYEKLS